MKAKISKKLKLPMYCGILGGLIAGEILALLVLHLMLGLPAGGAALMFLLPGIITLWQSMRRGAWVYSNVRKLHTAEYYYNLGNGAGFLKALEGYEHKVKIAIFVWLRRNFWLDGLKVYAVAFMLCYFAIGNSFRFIYMLVTTIVMLVFITYIAMWIMLISARYLCYDNYGNLKNT